MKRSSLGLAGVLATAAFISTADAHPQLKAAGPVPGSTIAAAPKTIRIQFSEGVELALSGIEVKNKAGEAQPVGAAAIDPKNKNILFVPLTGTLAPGVYTVNWHAVGDDTHKQEGHYNFEVKP